MMSIFAVAAAAAAIASHPYPGAPKADIYILAGQSNMQGSGRVTQHPKPDARLKMFNMDNTWMPCVPPDHRVFEGALPAYMLTTFKKIPGSTEASYKQMMAESKKSPLGGVGPGYFFGLKLAQTLNKPIGVIPCSYGGTSMDDWNPDAMATEGDGSLYGAMITRTKMVGTGNLKGIVWYQGESDAFGQKEADVYVAKFKNFIERVRKDLGKPNLPVFMVQIGRLYSFQTNPSAIVPWDQVRDYQRKMMSLVPNVYCVAASDCNMDDVIHLDWNGQQRLGNRLAELALNHVYNKPNCGIGIDLDKVTPLYIDNMPRIRVSFRNVVGKLKAEGLCTGFSLLDPSGQIPSAMVIDAVVEPSGNSVILKLTNVINKPEMLYYGQGVYNHINLVDGRDMPVPCFGPVQITPEMFTKK